MLLFGVEKADMEQRAKELEAKKARGKQSRRNEKKGYTGKIATERELIKRVEKAETRLKKKLIKNGRSWREQTEIRETKQGLELEREK